MIALKRSLSLLLAVLLAVSATGYIFAAEPMAEDDVYVLNYGVPDDDYTGPNMHYFSPYTIDYVYEDVANWSQIFVFSLYNTTNGEVVPAYCVDIKVGAQENSRYRRLNLEDSTYASTAAGQLRAIVMNGFYLPPIAGETAEQHNERAKQKLKELGEACGVPDLTVGEAVSGTQCAIWQAVHGPILHYTDFFRSFYSTKMPSAYLYYDLCNEERTNGHVTLSYGRPTAECDANINDRITAVYEYLLDLEPTAATSRVASAASFVKLSEPVLHANGDGTYDMDVTTTVDVDMEYGDYLTVYAKLGDYTSAGVSLHNGSQTITVTLEDVPQEFATEEVTLFIEGAQTISDVVLYDAYGEREASQTMIGMDHSRLPVKASVVATASERILHFYKSAKEYAGNGSYIRRPLEGIIFDIYHVASMSDYLDGTVILPDAKDYAYPDVSDYEVITDANGRATINFTQHGLPDGMYLIVERKHPAIEKPVDPFYIMMPGISADGTGYEYEITLQPKNQVKDEVDIEKDVTSIGNDESTVDAYEYHTWIIGATIPGDIADGKYFGISDVLDNRLDYLGNMGIFVESLDGQTVKKHLIPDVDYKLTVEDVDSLSEGKPSDRFVVEINEMGMDKIAAAVGSDNFENYMIRIYFEAQINANAKAGERIENQATLQYVNSVNFQFTVKSDKPVVYMGGVNLRKVDGKNPDQTLGGAVFEVYRPATNAEIMGKVDLVKLDGVDALVVQESFYDNPAMEGSKVTTVTTGENGEATIYGLAFGTYYLVETQAPEGYNKLSKPQRIEIDENSHTEAGVIIVENTAGAVLPTTGGMGTGIFTVTGTVLVAMSCLLLWLKKRQDAFNAE